MAYINELRHFLSHSLQEMEYKWPRTIIWTIKAGYVQIYDYVHKIAHKKL